MVIATLSLRFVAMPWAWIFVLIVLSPVPGTDITGTRQRALEFGKTSNDYIAFTTDMRPFRSSFSACAWMKRLHNATYPHVFDYYSYPDRITIGSSGIYNQVIVGLDLQRKFPGEAVWFHYCLTWLPGRTTVYIDGNQVGSSSTPVRELTQPGGKVVMGNYAPGDLTYEDYVFGGQLHKFNLFSGKLSSSDVQKMFSAGLCSKVEGDYDKIRMLKWEDILQKKRYGRVKDRTVTGSECAMSNLMGEINKIKNKINQTIQIWNDLDL